MSLTLKAARAVCTSRAVAGVPLLEEEPPLVIALFGDPLLEEEPPLVIALFGDPRPGVGMMVVT